MVSGDGMLITGRTFVDRGSSVNRLQLAIAAACLAASFFALPVCAQEPASTSLARVNGRVITEADVNRALGSALSRLEEQIYALKQQQLEKLISEQLLAEEAARKGVSTEALIATEVKAKVRTVPEEEVDQFIQANKSRLKGDPVSVRSQVRAHLEGREIKARRDALVRSLRERAAIEINFEPPPVYRAAVATDGFPTRGSATAPVTIVEFSDFHCPYCRLTQSALAEVLSKYAGKVKLVYRHFPLDGLHPDARKAAEAAHCAADQGKFWEYQDRLFGGNSDGSPAALKALAEAIGLDVAVFQQCLGSGKQRQAVQRDVEEGTRLGVTATPTFFINGRMLVGGQSVEALARVIEQELARR